MFAKFDIAASQTDSALVAAVTGSRIRVHSYALLAGATATDATFTTKPAGAGTAISMVHQLGVRIPCVLPESTNGGHGWFQTNASEGLSLTTGAGSTVGVHIVYSLVKVTSP